MSSTLDPSDEPRPAENETLPGEEHVDPAKVDEQLATEPEEAENFPDGYAPADDEDFED